MKSGVHLITEEPRDPADPQTLVGRVIERAEIDDIKTPAFLALTLDGGDAVSIRASNVLDGADLRFFSARVLQWSGDARSIDGPTAVRWLEGRRVATAEMDAAERPSFLALTADTGEVLSMAADSREGADLYVITGRVLSYRDYETRSG